MMEDIVQSSEDKYGTQIRILYSVKILNMTKGKESYLGIQELQYLTFIRKLSLECIPATLGHDIHDEGLYPKDLKHFHNSVVRHPN